MKGVRGGVLVQERSRPVIDATDWTVVSTRRPTDAESTDLLFAWRAVASVKSNAIVLARGGGDDRDRRGADVPGRCLLPRGAQGPERGPCHRWGLARLRRLLPFRDGIDQAAAAGVTAIVQPGGSVRDAEVIAAANEHGMAMVFTGRRTFRH